MGKMVGNERLRFALVSAFGLGSNSLTPGGRVKKMVGNERFELPTPSV